MKLIIHNLNVTIQKKKCITNKISTLEILMDFGEIF